MKLATVHFTHSTSEISLFQNYRPTFLKRLYVDTRRTNTNNNNSSYAKLRPESHQKSVKSQPKKLSFLFKIMKSIAATREIIAQTIRVPQAILLSPSPCFKIHFRHNGFESTYSRSTPGCSNASPTGGESKNHVRCTCLLDWLCLRCCFAIRFCSVILTSIGFSFHSNLHLTFTDDSKNGQDVLHQMCWNFGRSS